MKLLVSYNEDCGRMGSVSGMFVCNEEDLPRVYRSIYFGEILGKHSNIRLIFRPEDFKIHSDDQEFISRLVEYVGNDTIYGYNPFHYLPEEE